MPGLYPVVTLHADASLVRVTSFRVVGLTFVNALIVEGQVRQRERGTFGAGARFGRQQPINLPPPQFWDWTTRTNRLNRTSSGSRLHRYHAPRKIC